MFCNYCGAEIKQSKSFCGQCGKPVKKAAGKTVFILEPEPEKKEQQPRKEERPWKKANEYTSGAFINEPPPQKKIWPVVVLAVVAMLLLTSGVVATRYLLKLNVGEQTVDTLAGGQAVVFGGETGDVAGEISQANTASDRDSNTTLNAASNAGSSISQNSTAQNADFSATNAQTRSAVVSNPTYYVFDDTLYHTLCAYPTHFTKLDNIGVEDRLLLKSQDGTAMMAVRASMNSAKLTAKDAMTQFIQSTGGNLEYNANGETWYAVSIKKNGIWYYRKCFVDDYIRWFDFSFPVEYEPIYQKYINYIEDNFSRK